MGLSLRPFIATPDADVQGLLDQLGSQGGGRLALSAGTFDPFTIPSGVQVDGEGEATVIRAPDGHNADIVASEDFAALTGTNTWLASAGVPHGFGLSNVRIEGNKANNASGRGIAFYGKRFTLNNVVVADCAGDGIYTECAAVGGQESADDLPETNCAAVFVHGCDGDGWQMRGPHDAYIDSVFVSSCGGVGLHAAISASHSGTCDIGYAHIYACDQGLVDDAGTRIGVLQTESNQRHGAIFNAGRTTIGSLYAFKNWAQDKATETAQTNPSITFAGRVSCATADIRTDYGGTGLLVTGLGSTCPSLLLDGVGKGGIGLDVQANRINMRGDFQRCSGTGGIGIRVGQGGARHQTMLDFTGGDCATLVKEVAAGNRNRWTVMGFVNAGQTAFEALSTGTNNVRDLISN